MKAIILAGGLGSRLGKYTTDVPKCMLRFKGKTLIERQIDTYRECGIKDIIVVRKHLAHKINLSGVRYIDEVDYNTHMVVGLFQARHEFDEDFIMSYGDIVFESRLLFDAIESKADIGIVVDTHWTEYWEARLGNWMSDSESFVIGKGNRVISLGEPNPPESKMNARYIGMVKFSSSILSEIKKVYDKACQDYWDKPWYTSKSFRKAYMTDFLQALIDNGIDVRAILVQRGWLEFDTNKDYELIREWQDNGTLSRFIELEE